jgi:hypothetical protein
MTRYAMPITMAVTAGLLLLVPCIACAQTWVEDSFEDFVDGTLDAAGQNIYVSRDGTVQTIHRFDLNQDGQVDLLFNSTHDISNYVAPTLGVVKGDRRTGHTALAVRGSLDVKLADLNRDGHLDAVFCPNASGIQHPRRFVTIIWGGDDGWPASRSNGVLPSHSAKALAIVDLNRDGWPDIAVLNGKAWLPGQPDGAIVRIFWGSAGSFLLSEYLDLGVASALDLASSDFNGDGFDELAVLCSNQTIRVISAAGADETESTDIPLPGDGAACLAVADVTADGVNDLIVGTNGEHLHIALGTDGGAWEAALSVPAWPATHVSTSDLDRDGHADLLLTHASLSVAAGGEATGTDEDALGYVRVLWGSASGFNREQSTSFDAAYATATAAGDLDGDGHPDVAVAVHQGDKTFEARSLVYFGGSNRGFAKSPEGFQTFGALGVAVAPAEHGTPGRVVFANSVRGAVSERTPLYLYWGAPDGFTATNRTLIPFLSGYESTAADLNNDGLVDLVALCSGHGGPAFKGLSELGANIFWGKKNDATFSGPTTVLTEQYLFNSNVADLDKDGYLDLVLGAFAPPTPGEVELLVIYYGGETGYSAERRVVLPSEGRSAICAIGDYDKDDYLDIAVTSYVTDLVRIFRGGPQGFSEERQDKIKAPAPIAMETADLNADGYLDLVVGSYFDRVAGHHDTGNFIFWGSPDGFKEWNAQWLPGMTPVGLTVADWDADGHLDIFSPHYHGELTRDGLPSYLYWGGSDGFNIARRTALVNDSASEGFAGDFDRDGLLDLAVANHTVDGDHMGQSKVFYNDGSRFESPRVTSLPTAGPHWSWTEDMGHIYDRAWSQTYVSSPFTWTPSTTRGTLTSEASIPEGTSLRFEIRSAPDTAALDSQPWIDVEGQAFALSKKDRALQYRTTFLSDNGDRFPKLDLVEVRLVP